MSRQAIDDGVSWFDPDASTKWEENTWWNGNNHISSATGSQWEHEALYLTASNNWVRNRWSQCQGTGETWELISGEEAVRWLVKNDHTDLEELPDDVADLVGRLLEESEV